MDRDERRDEICQEKNGEQTQESRGDEDPGRCVSLRIFIFPHAANPVAAKDEERVHRPIARIKTTGVGDEDGYSEEKAECARPENTEAKRLHDSMTLTATESLVNAGSSYAVPRALTISCHALNSPMRLSR